MATRPALTVTLLSCSALLLVSGCAGTASEPSSPSPSSSSTSEGAAHCTGVGGEVVAMQPTFNTNNARSTWVALGEPVDVCMFRSAEDSTMIYTDLATLSSKKPTLAALAYLSKTPMPKSEGGSNPAFGLCTELGGAVGYGTGMAGGGLVPVRDATDDDVYSPCTFADGSMIDDWGIAYYSSGTIRGTDLTKLFQFDMGSLPPVFPS